MTYGCSDVESEFMRRVEDVVLGKPGLDRRKRWDDEQGVLEGELLSADCDAGEAGGGGEGESEGIRKRRTVDAVSRICCEIALCVCTSIRDGSMSIDERYPNSMSQFVRIEIGHVWRTLCS